jgi:hypothetical protein
MSRSDVLAETVAYSAAPEQPSGLRGAYRSWKPARRPNLSAALSLFASVKRRAPGNFE